MNGNRILEAAALALGLSLEAAHAGGAWVPEPGQGTIGFGISAKTAGSSWDRKGDAFDNRRTLDRKISYHDFRYGYLAGEVGLLRNLSGTFLVAYLDGREGPTGATEKNSGLTDAWYGLKYAVHKGSLPMAIGFTYRSSEFYDLEGPYNRHLFDQNGDFRGVSPEWRGLLKHDYTLSYLVSRSIRGGRGWWNLQSGYTWREGAPADEVPLLFDLGYPLPWGGVVGKVSVAAVRSLGNDSPRRPDDRFGSSRTTNFNDASMARLGVSGFKSFGRDGRWFGEVGYNQWVWGRSARRYREPYLAIGRKF